MVRVHRSSAGGGPQIINWSGLHRPLEGTGYSRAFLTPLQAPSAQQRSEDFPQYCSYNAFCHQGQCNTYTPPNIAGYIVGGRYQQVCLMDFVHILLNLLIIFDFNNEMDIKLDKIT